MANEGTQDHKQQANPAEMTQPGWSFVREYERLYGFIIYLTDLATSTDEKAKVAVRALYESQDPEKYRESLERIEKRGATQALRTLYRTLVLEMMLSRGADNLLTYVTELLALVFRTRPETLRASAETVRVEDVLKHTTMEELIHEMAERRVNQLSYRGMRDLSTYLSDRLSFELFPDLENLERAVRIIESRNLIVHNRGIANALFLSRVPNVSATAGELLHLDSDQVFDDLEFIALSVEDIDARAAQKFRLSVGPRIDASDTPLREDTS